MKKLIEREVFFFDFFAKKSKKNTSLSKESFFSGMKTSHFQKVYSNLDFIMNNQQKLIFIKLLHTVVWAVMVAAIFYIIYSGWSGSISTLTYIALVLIGLEVIILLANKWVCPMTPMARRYSDNPKDNFDIYLPEWLAKYNKVIFGTLLVAGIVLIVWRLTIEK